MLDEQRRVSIWSGAIRLDGEMPSWCRQSVKEYVDEALPTQHVPA
jgi:hypothetical protein